jgi:cysteine desulfurase
LEVFFTSSGTESNNWALKSVANAYRGKGRHIIVSAIEHDCILNTCNWLTEQGFFITYLPVDSDGVVDLEVLKESINPKTILVSVMHANNEIGTIEPIEAIGRLCRQNNVLFHTDACQSYGKIRVDVNDICADLLTVNSHKIYGPKGIGALYIRKGVKIEPLLHGGGQEAGLRSSTENIPAITGFARAAELCMQEMDMEARRLAQLRQKLVTFIEQNYPNAYINGHREQRLPGHLSFSFHGLEGETIRLLLLLDEIGIAVSAGSACSSNDKSHSASHVLQAIGLNPFEARGAIRVSMGRFTTENDIDIFIDSLGDALNNLTSIFSENSVLNR